MTQCGVHGSMEYVKQLEAERDALRAALAALRARINDLKGMAEEIYRFQTGCRWETTTKYEKKEYMVIARAVSAWLKEGK